MSLFERIWAKRMARLHESVHRDRTLAIHVSLWKRVLFLLTNVPYFLVATLVFQAVELSYPGQRYFQALGTYFCESTTAIGLGVLAVGCASTAMHFSQMKLFGCTHQSGAVGKEPLNLARETCLCSIYSREVFIVLKHMDVGCVFCGLLAGILCCGIWALLSNMLPVGKQQ